MKRLFLLVYLFFLIYTPPIFFINMRHIIGLIAWVGLIAHFKNFTKLIRSFNVIFVELTLLLMLIYIAVIASLNGNNLRVVSFFLYWLVDIIPGAAFAAIYCNCLKVDCMEVIIKVGVLQGLLSVIAFISGDFQQILLNIMANSGFYTKEFLDSVKNWRAYGLSSALFFDMPIVQAYLGIFSVYLGFTKNVKYYIYSCVLFFSALINARTSFAVILLGVFFLVFNKKILNLKKEQFLKLMGILLLIVPAFLMIFKGINDNNATVTWVIQGIKEFNPFAKDRHTVDILLDKMVIYPDSIGMVFGKGVRIMGGNDKYNVGSDIGYINDLWMGGMIYSVGIYMLFAYILNVIRKKYIFGEKLVNIFFMFTLSVFIVCNVKGQIYSPNCFTVLIMILFMESCLKWRESIK